MHTQATMSTVSSDAATNFPHAANSGGSMLRAPAMTEPVDRTQPKATSALQASSAAPAVSEGATFAKESAKGLAAFSCLCCVAALSLAGFHVWGLVGLPPRGFVGVRHLPRVWPATVAARCDFGLGMAAVGGL
jgi:hypothetical protein